MAKIYIIIFQLISSLMIIADAQALLQKREKIAKFRVYVQEARRGPNATAYEVARANITSTSPTSFGLVIVGDNLMTAGPDPNSQNLGRFQGFVVYSGLEEPAITINAVYVFTAGNYKSSTLSILGWRPATVGDREFTIVGGTGSFRSARGYIVSNIYSYDPVTDYYVFVYDIHVVYQE